jgi:hypothetical protein
VFADKSWTNVNTVNRCAATRFIRGKMRFKPPSLGT